MTRRLGCVVVALGASLSAACHGTTASPAVPSTITSPVTETFSSNLVPRSAAIRSFRTPVAGTIVVTLTDLSAPGAHVGLGLGVTGGSDACSLSTSVVTSQTSTPQISQTVDPGAYCVQVFDIGETVSPLTFSVTIQHP